MKVGDLAPNFKLEDENKNIKSLSDFLLKGPVLLVFYPGDFTPVCTKQLCNYQNNMSGFENLNIQVVGISANTSEEHKAFSKAYNFSFPLLTDANKEVAKLYGCTSLLMFGGVSRAIVIISKEGRVVYHYVEPTVVTRRKADELLKVVEDLKRRELI